MFVYFLHLSFERSMWWAFDNAVMTNMRDEVVFEICFYNSAYIYVIHAVTSDGTLSDLAWRQTFLLYIKPLSVPETPRGCVITDITWYRGNDTGKTRTIVSGFIYWEFATGCNKVRLVSSTWPIFISTPISTRRLSKELHEISYWAFVLKFLEALLFFLTCPR